MSVFTSAELVAAVSNAGGLGTLGAWRRPDDSLAQHLDRLRELTDQPFAVNHLVPDLNEEAFAMTLAAKPRVVSLALGDPGDLVKRAHDIGSLVVHQVTTVAQAVEAAERGVDVIIAQGGESGGYGGTIATLPLVPGVVDAVAPVPVVASGGVADGRGLAAVMALGAVGVNLGTRFLASTESPIADAWKQRLVDASSEDAVKFAVLNVISPVPGTLGYGTSVRALRTAFIDKWEAEPEEAARIAEQLANELRTAGGEGRIHEFMPGAGQSVGGVHEVLPAGEIIGRLVREAETTLARLGSES